MLCPINRPVYRPHSNAGIIDAITQGDGYGIMLRWNQAYPDNINYAIAYNIYYSSILEDVFTEGVKFVSPSNTNFATIIQELTPGDTYFFAVRATEWDPAWYDVNLLPDAPDLKLLPESILSSTISSTETFIPIMDLNEFPAYGVVQIGYEFIRYTGKDLPSSSLVGLTRGFLETEAREHEPDGYDGYVMHDNPLVRFFKGFEEENGVVFQETPHFLYPNYARTNADGYRVVTKDLLNTDLGGSDASNADFPSVDFVGWHRTDPVALLRGDCLGTYIGGERYCADGYLGVGNQVRGISVQDVNTQRQEELLELTGEPVVLVKKVWTGIRCSCYTALNEYPEDRCPNCFGSGFVTGYQQYFNPKRSDGRILMRFDPTEDDLTHINAGIESTFSPSAWTLVVPAIHDEDFIIRFTEDGQEEFRYEIINVTRNKLLNSLSGAQKVKLARVRKTDPIYQWRAIRSTATMPTTLITSVGMTPGPGGILPHTHTLVINEGIVSLSQINETTSHSGTNGQLHSHPIIDGIVQTVLSHTHQIILP